MDNGQWTMNLEDYILAHIDPEPDYLHRLWRATNLHLNYPRMASGHLQGRVLAMLVHMIRPKTVLEIGTFTGYSALCMASALNPDAVLHTIEINDEQEEFTRPWLENSPWADRIRLHIGDALEILADSPPALPIREGAVCSEQASAFTESSVIAPSQKFPSPTGEGLGVRLGGESPFDLVFIDADKRQYVDYYRAVLPLVRPGGFIIADNTLWDGQVVTVPEGSSSMKRHSVPSAPEGSSPHNGKEAQLQGILAFNDLIAADPAVERVILPLRDGLTLIRKLP